MTDRQLLQPRVHCPEKESKHGFGLLVCSKGRPTSLSIAAAKLVAKEHDMNYDAAKATKQESITQEAVTRYLAALAFTGLNSERHTSLKADVKHNWVQNNVDSLPRTYERLIEMAGGYETRDRPRRDPRGAGLGGTRWPPFCSQPKLIIYVGPI